MIRRPARNRLGVLDTRPRLLTVAEFRDLKPQDGDEVYINYSVNNVRWHFRYESDDTSGYPWYFIGGSSAAHYIASEETQTAAGVWGDVATVGPTITVPLAGDYRATAAARMQNTYAAANRGGIAICLGTSAPTSSHDADTAATGHYESLSYTHVLTGLSANQELRVRYTSTSNGNKFGFRSLLVVPARVRQAP